MRNALFFVGGLIGGLAIGYVAIMLYLSKAFRQ